MRDRIKIGDIFEVKLNASSKKFFQYIGNDISQLNSQVIRIFAKKYALGYIPSHLEIIKGEIEFYAHCVIKYGVKFKYWNKIGNINDLGNLDNIWFRDIDDFVDLKSDFADDWWIWKMNKTPTHIGKIMEDKHKKADIGIIINPESIFYRIENGVYNFKYPNISVK